MKKFLLSLVSLLMFAIGSAWAVDVTLAPGTNGSACTVNEMAGIKVGTSKAGGDMTITVPANTTKLTFYAAAWKGAAVTVSITGVTADPSSLDLTANDGISNNSPFTLSEGTNVDTYKFEVALSDVTEETTITLSAEKRFVVWNASAEAGSEDPVDPYDAALTAIGDGGTYFISTDVNGTKYYITADGKLTSTRANGCIFTLTKVEGNGYKQFGYYIDGGKRFSNAPLSSSKAVLDVANYSTSTDNRNTWEAQVLLLNDGKYAIRATNVAYGESGWSDAGRVFFTWKVDDVAIPQYTYDEVYQWNLEAATPITVTYKLVEADGTTEVSSEAKKQEANSEVNIPTSMTGISFNGGWTPNAYYTYEAIGTIGDTDCEVVVKRTPTVGVVHALTDLSNGKAYAIRCKRGAILTSGETIASTSHATLHDAAPANFAVLNYEDNYYLYSVADKKFVLNTGALAIMPTHGKYDAIQMTSQTDPYFLFTFKIDETTTYGLNTNGTGALKGCVINNWISPDDGDQYYMIEAADFDATEALTALEAYFHPANFVTYVVKDAAGNLLFTSDKIAALPGSKITTLPAEYQRDFTTYNEVDVTITEAETTVEFTATSTFPFELSSSVADAKWYYMTIRNDYYVALDETEPYYPKADKDLTANSTQWAFIGNAYGITLYNKATGADKSLTPDNGNAVMRDGAYAWEIFKNNDGFVLREAGTANKWINQSGGSSGPLQFWDSANGKTDNGSTFRVQAVPEVELAAPTFNVEEGTQAAPNKLAAGSTLKINYTANNLALYGYNADDLKVKVTVLLSGDLPENLMTMGSETAHTVRGASFYIPLGETDFPVALKPGYVYQNIVILGADLVKNAETDSEEVIASYAGAPVQLHWVGIEAKVIYIETDMTSQFAALTQVSNWQSGTSAGCGEAGWAAPEVTVNGQKVKLIENYVEGQDKKQATGDVMYQTVTGLAAGTYTIELFGAANLTEGRAGMTTDFAEGDEASLKAVYLYAETTAGTVKQYIPCLIESNFNNRGGEEAVPTAKLEGIVVGEDGQVKIGIYKEVGLTNWHFVQLKSVSATVDAKSMLAASVEAAQAIDKATIPAALATKLDNTVAENNKSYDTADDYQAAINAIDAVVADAKAYAPLTAALAQGEVYKAHVAEGNEAITTYETAIADVVTAYEAATVADIPAAIATVEAALPALAKAQTLAGADMTVFITNPDFETGNTEGWTYESSNDHGAKSTSEANYAMEGASGNYLFNIWSSGNAISQTIEGLPAGMYELKAVIATDEGQQVQLNANDQSVQIDATGKGNGIDSAISFLVTDGKATIGAEGVNKWWYKVDNFRLTLVNPMTADNAEYLAALVAIGDGGDYYISTDVEETKYYITSAGKLTSNRADATIFTLTKTDGGALQTYGYFIDGGGTRFTNPPLADNKANLNPGVYATSSNNRKDWEAQVLFLENGKYAIRSCNTAPAESSWGDAGRTFFTWKVEDVAVPQYTYDQVYQWNLEAATAIVNVTYLLVESDGTTEVSSVVIKQEGNSEVNVPASLTSNFLYNYAVEGTIGTEDCTIKITRTKKSTVNALADLSNAKAYVIACDRGALLAKEDHMYSTGLKDLADAQPTNFAVIYYDETEDETDNGSYYLYSASEKKFVLNDGSLAAMPTHGKFDALQMEAKDAPYFFCYFTVADGTNYGLNTNGNAPYGYVINDWMNADPGNLYYMIEAADFDATEALAALYAYYNPSYYVTYVVKDAAGKELFKSEPAPTMLGTKITTLPAAYQRPFTTYNEVDVTIAEENTTVEFTATSAFPFELSTDFASAKWYNMTIRGEWWVGTEGKNNDEGIPVAEPYYPVQKTDDDAALLVKPAYQWAFSGDAYNGIIVWNKGAGAGFTLTSADEMAVMREGEYLWTIGQNSDGFTLRETGTEFNCINQNGGAGGPLSFWKSSGSLGDNGSTFRISEAPAADPVEFSIKENEKKTGIGSGTQDAPTKVKIDTPFKLQATAKNKAANNLQDEDLTIHFDKIVISSFKDAAWTMSGNPVTLQDVTVPYAQYFEIPDIVFSEEYPFIQSITFMGAKLMKGDEVVAEFNPEEPFAVRFLEIVDKEGNPVGIKSIFDENVENVFDLSGRKVQKVQKGRAYIIDGKKAVIRKK
ncbi:MAG: hypothetical protein K6G70_05910 [Bacteroidaceae bacterium]|nr:hypothetical protein [Bacteroidaceae bacterium]